MPHAARPTMPATIRLAVPQHPLYTAWAPTWAALRDLVDAGGGFLAPNRPYLVPHPREWDDHTIIDPVSGKPSPNPSPSQPSKKLQERRRLARYENLAGALLRILQGALFRQLPQRQMNGKAVPDTHPVRAWWTNIDGTRTDIDYWLSDQWLAAATYGHLVWYLDRPAGVPALTAADVPPLYVRSYTPLDVLDWLEDDLGNISAVVLQEAEPRESFQTALTFVGRIREVTTDGWTLRRQTKRGRPVEALDTQPHGFNALPIVYLFARRKALTAHIGESALGDPQLFLDDYNLISEERELLRKQTFGLLNVPVGQNGNVETEKALIGASAGTSHVLFTSGTAAYISPDPGNVTAYQDHRDRLLRQIYRLIGVPFETDSRAAESAESRRLKREELGQVLSSYADELERADYALHELWYRGTYGDQWQRQWDRDQLTIVYPDQFDKDTLDQVIANATALLGLDLPPEAAKPIKVRTLKAALPDLDAETWQTIEAALEKQATAPPEPTADAFGRLVTETPAAREEADDAA